MKIITVEYKNSRGKWTNYFIDSVSGKTIMAGTVADVSEERAKVLCGDNKYNIQFAKPYKELEPLIEVISPDLLLAEMTREELIEYATGLGIKFPKNIKTENLINKLLNYEEKQNS